MFKRVDDETVLHTDDPVAHWYKGRQIEFNTLTAKRLGHIPYFQFGEVRCKKCHGTCEYFKSNLDFEILDSKDTDIFFYFVDNKPFDHVFTPEGLLYTTVGSLPKQVTETYFNDLPSDTIICRNRQGQWNDTAYGENYSDFLRHWIKDPEVTLTMDCNEFHRDIPIPESVSTGEVSEEALSKFKEDMANTWGEIKTLYQTAADKVSEKFGRSGTPKDRTRNRDKNRKANKLARKARRK